MSTIKSEFRKKCKAIRFECEKKNACEEAFMSSSLYKENKILLIYASFGSEADTFELIKNALDSDKSVFLPRISGNEMKFYRIYDTNNLKKGTFGVMEPTEGEEYSGQRAACIIPGLAFDKNGNRLGYGKGYYDKFLSKYPGVVKIGFCSACCFFEEIPYEETDIKMDYIFIDDVLIGI